MLTSSGRRTLNENDFFRDNNEAINESKMETHHHQRTQLAIAS